MIMDKKQFFFGLLFASLFGGILAIGGYKLMEPERPLNQNSSEDQNVRFSNYTMDTSQVVIPQGLNFVFASKLVTPNCATRPSLRNSSSQNSVSSHEASG